jgi:large subunit ribosomal protein L21
MATSRLSQAPAVQGADEERKGDVREGTATAHRSSQRSNVDVSSTGVSGLAAQQGRTVRKSGKRAVIATGGKQYLVSENEELEVEKLPAEKIATFEALLVIDGDKISLGKPAVTGVKVTADVVEQVVKAPKVTAIRYKAKKRVNKVRGHRQKLTRIKITKIGSGG